MRQDCARTAGRARARVLPLSPSPHLAHPLSPSRLSLLSFPLTPPPPPLIVFCLFLCPPPLLLSFHFSSFTYGALASPPFSLVLTFFLLPLHHDETGGLSLTPSLSLSLPPPLLSSSLPFLLLSSLPPLLPSTLLPSPSSSQVLTVVLLNETPHLSSALPLENLHSLLPPSFRTNLLGAGFRLSPLDPKLEEFGRKCCCFRSNSAFILKMLIRF